MESGIWIGVLLGLIGGVAVLLNTLIEQKTCPNCGTKLPRFNLSGGWTCSNCGCEIDSRGNKVEITQSIAAPAEAAPNASPTEAMPAPAQTSTRRSWGCAVTVLGVLFLLLGIVALLILGAFGFSDTAAQALAQGDTDQIVVPLLTCPLPLLIIGGVVFYLGRRLASSGK